MQILCTSYYAQHSTYFRSFKLWYILKYYVLKYYGRCYVNYEYLEIISWRWSKILGGERVLFGGNNIIFCYIFPACVHQILKRSNLNLEWRQEKYLGWCIQNSSEKITITHSGRILNNKYYTPVHPTHLRNVTHFLIERTMCNIDVFYIVEIGPYSKSMRTLIN